MSPFQLTWGDPSGALPDGGSDLSAAAPSSSSSALDFLRRLPRVRAAWSLWLATVLMTMATTSHWCCAEVEIYIIYIYLSIYLFIYLYLYLFICLYIIICIYYICILRSTIIIKKAWTFFINYCKNPPPFDGGILHSCISRMVLDHGIQQHAVTLVGAVWSETSKIG